jgi:recombination protein RecA
MNDDKSRKQKTQALELAISAVEKEFGKGSIMRLRDGESLVRDVPTVPTGSLSLDINLGVGGYPRGRIVEIYGPESSGKTTLTLHAIANIQRQGGTAAFIDAEHALDLQYARKLGVQTEELLVSQPDYGEQALEIADMLVRSGTIDCIVVDSVAALVPKAELEGDMGDSHVGLQARLMSQALRKLAGSLNKSSCLMMFINQLRMKIGVMFGSPETTTGGNALKFYSSVRLRVARVGAIKEAAGGGREPEVVGNRTRVKVTKNKIAPPFRECEFDILYGRGISRSGDVLDLASECGIVEKSGSWFSFENDRLGQGREKVRAYLEENPALLDRIEDMLLLKNGLKPRKAVGSGPTPKDATSPASGSSSSSSPGAPPNPRTNEGGSRAAATPSEKPGEKIAIEPIIMTPPEGANGRAAKRPADAKQAPARGRAS